jgi:hypothetical protein
MPSGQGQGPTYEQATRAWELHAQHYSYKHAAEILSEEFKLPKVISHETARQWAMRGEKVNVFSELLDETWSRKRAAARLEILAGWVHDAIAGGVMSLDEGLKHLRWMIRESALLLGTDAARKASVSFTGEAPRAAPDPEVMAAIRAFTAENGRP